MTILGNNSPGASTRVLYEGSNAYHGVCIQIIPTKTFVVDSMSFYGKASNSSYFSQATITIGTLSGIYLNHVGDIGGSAGLGYWCGYINSKNTTLHWETWTFNAAKKPILLKNNTYYAVVQNNVLAYYWRLAYISTSDTYNTHGIKSVGNGTASFQITDETGRSYCIYLSGTEYDYDIIGNPGIGTSYASFVANGYNLSKVVVSSTFNVDKMYVYCYLVDPWLVKGVIMDSTGAIVANAITTAGNPTNTSTGSWLELNFTTKPSLSAGTYYLGVISNASGGQVWYTTGATGDGGNETDNSGYASPTGMAPISQTNSTRKFNIYLTSTVSTGPALKIEGITPGKLEYTSWSEINTVR